MTSTLEDCQRFEKMAKQVSREQYEMLKVLINHCYKSVAINSAPTRTTTAATTITTAATGVTAEDVQAWRKKFEKIVRNIRMKR